MKLKLVFQFSGTFLVVLITAFVIGCAGGSINKVRHYSSMEPLVRPSVVLIYNFAVDPDDVVVDTFGPNFGRSEKEETSEILEAGRAVADALAEKMVAELKERGIEAQRAATSTEVPVNAFLVKGQFVTINEGDAMRRMTIGFGAGSDEIRAQVQVYQMKEGGNLRMIVEGEAEAHGKKTPGVGPAAIMTAGVGTVVPVVVSSTINLKSEALDGSMATNVKNFAEQFAERAVTFYERLGWL